MPESFIIKAGSKARKHIRKNGLHAADISTLVGAAGGPKWIVLYGLDKYLMNEWFSNQDQEFHLVGASAGAWRMLCYALENPTLAIDRFLSSYAGQTYTSMPDQDEVEEKLQEIIAFILDKQDLNQFYNNALRKLYVISSASHFNKKSNSKYKFDFLKLVLRNTISRKTLAKSLERIVFTNSKDSNLIKEDSFRTQYVRFDNHNIYDAIRSTGTLPMYMNPVENIKGIDGLLWDGALIDYHIGCDYNNEGLILYPHFADDIIEGWFDKFVPWRKFSGGVMERMIMISPSQSYIQSLPDSKIPDRGDFNKYFNDNDLRIKNWHIVAERSKEIAVEFHELWTSGKLYDKIEPF